MAKIVNLIQLNNGSNWKLDNIDNRTKIDKIENWIYNWKLDLKIRQNWSKLKIGQKWKSWQKWWRIRFFKCKIFFQILVDIIHKPKKKIKIKNQVFERLKNVQTFMSIVQPFLFFCNLLCSTPLQTLKQRKVTLTFQKSSAHPTCIHLVWDSRTGFEV